LDILDGQVHLTLCKKWSSLLKENWKAGKQTQSIRPMSDPSLFGRLFSTTLSSITRQTCKYQQGNKSSIKKEFSVIIVKQYFKLKPDTFIKNYFSLPKAPKIDFSYTMLLSKNSTTPKLPHYH